MAETETPVPAAPEDDENSLENPDNSSKSHESTDVPKGDITDATSEASNMAPAPPAKKPGGIKNLIRRFNIYFLLFVFLLLIAGIILAIAYFESKKASTTNTIQTQELTQAALQKIAESDSTVGSSAQVLKVQSSAIFAGRVLVREGLEVAGNLQVGGTVALTNLTVSGTSQLGQTQVNKDLAVAGNTAIQGTATIAKSLQVNGSGTFNGPVSSPQITTSNLQLNGDLVLTHHITAAGPPPTLTRGPALGSGGTASVGGSDTAGTVSINVGGGAPGGCFVTINFASKYSSTPRVLITPVGSDAGGLNYYVNRTSAGFSICNSTSPGGGLSFAFDYFVVN